LIVACIMQVNMATFAARVNNMKDVIVMITYPCGLDSPTFCDNLESELAKANFTVVRIVSRVKPMIATLKLPVLGRWFRVIQWAVTAK